MSSSDQLSAVIAGGKGSNVVHADDYPQLVVLGEDDDTLNGGGGNDTIGSAAGDDLLIGGEGHDSIFGGEGDDHLRGGTHNDMLRGRRGNDWLNGGQGDDKLDGGPGKDILKGGRGADRFKLSAGRDSITDYNPTEGDRLLFSKDLELSITEAGNDVILADKSNEIHTVLLNTSLESVIASHPQLA